MWRHLAIGVSNNKNHAKMHAVTASLTRPRRVEEAGKL